MNEPNWLARTDVEALHDMAIDKAGGSYGLRDGSLLESALARPQNLHAYGEDDIFQLAASYAEGVARNHAFVDGNKRTALAAAMMFLHDNGYKVLKRDDDGYVAMMESLGQGKMSREKAGAYLQENSQKIEQQRSRSETEQGGIVQTWVERKNGLNGDAPEKKPAQSPSRDRKQ